MPDAATALHELLRRLCQHTLGVGENFFRPAGQRAPAGPASAPFATINVISNELASFNLRRWSPDDPAVAAVTPPVGEHETPPDLLEVLEGLDQVVASVQFYRDGAVDGVGRPVWGDAAHARAASLVRRLEMTFSVERANLYGLAYSSASAVRNLSSVVDGSSERRAQVDLTFYVANAEVVAMSMFRTLSIAIQVQQPDGHINEVSA